VLHDERHLLHLEVLEPRTRRLLEHQALARRLRVVHPLVLLGAPLLLGSLRPLAHLLLPLALPLQPSHLVRIKVRVRVRVRDRVRVR